MDLSNQIFIPILVSLITALLTSLAANIFYFKNNTRKLLLPNSILQANIYNITDTFDKTSIIIDRNTRCYNLSLIYNANIKSNFTLNSLTNFYSFNDFNNTSCAIEIENADTKNLRLESLNWSNQSVYSTSSLNNIILSKHCKLIIVCNMRDLPDSIVLSFPYYLVTLQYDTPTMRYITKYKKTKA